MADKEIYELDIEIDNRDIDKTEKKLRGLDKLLQQTQRRAVLLGKTRIRPAISLVDRFTSAAGKIGDTLTRLHRTTARPAVQLDDRVSNAAVKLHGSLASLTAAPWRVSVAGVDWETAVGGSFSNWMSSGGKSTLKRISTTIATALGDGLQGRIMEALGVTGMSWQANSVQDGGDTRQKNSGNSETILMPDSGGGSTLYTAKNILSDIASKRWSPNKVKSPGFLEDGSYYSVSDFLTGISKKEGPAVSSPKIPDKTESLTNNRSIYAEAGVKAGQAFFQAFLSVLDPKQIGEKLSDVNWEFTGEKSKDSNGWLEKVWEVGSQILGSVVADLIAQGIGKKIFKSEVNATSSKVALPKGVTTVVNSGRAIGKKILGPIATLFTFDAVDKAGYYAGDWLFGHEKGQKYNKPGIFDNPFKMDTYEDYRPGILKRLYNYFNGIDENLNSGSNLTGLNSPFNKLPETFKPVEFIPPDVKYNNFINDVNKMYAGSRDFEGNNQQYNLPSYQNSNMETRQQDSKGQTSININVSPGLVTMNVQKDKINYDELAKAAGWKIANEVRFAMQNLK